MVYNNPFFYNRDSSVDPKYSYVDVSVYRPIYGSSVSFKSRLNSLDTIDNSIKIMPASANNLKIKYSLRFLLDDANTGNLLKSIEIAGGYRYLKFKDPSGLYIDFLGLVESYSINKNSNFLNEILLDVNVYFKSPLLKWRTSCLLNGIDKASSNFVNGKIYQLYDIVYSDYFNTTNQFTSSTNLIDNFFIKKSSEQLGTNYTNFFSHFSKNFIFDCKIPFSIQNEFDVYKTEFKNSFNQNIKYKNNSNSLKKFNLKFENITTQQCKAMLFFLEKRCGYRRFIYDFPIFLKKNKVFVCSEWDHSFKYENCHDIDVLFMEDPQPNVKFFDYQNQTIYYL